MISDPRRVVPNPCASRSRTAAGQTRLRVGACLSLSGRYARFGTQAARGLEVWRSLDGDADLALEDDRSEPRALETALRRVVARCDVLLGPYSTQLMREAGRIAAEADWLVWNHGGSGDDVEAARPGHIVSVLTPTSRYALPFLRHLSNSSDPARLWIVHGKGKFARQVAEGAEATGRRFGVTAVRIGPEDELPSVDPSSRWDLFSVGTFEDDVRTVQRAQRLSHPPRTVCTVAAGVREFANEVQDVEGIYGVGQWFPGSGRTPELGPNEEDFLRAYARLTGTAPDYPAVQAAAGAVLAAHCARRAGGRSRELLWPTATELDTETLFGGFRVDPADGVQVKHETVLVHWSQEGLTAA